MDKLPLTFYQQCLEIVIGIGSLISRCSIANFEIHDGFGRLVEQTVTVPGACLEARAHARRKLDSAFIGVQRRVTLQYVDEFVLLSVCVTKGRNRIGG